MKELEKTKHISVSLVLFLLVIVIGVLTFKKPEHVFKKTTAHTLDKIVEQDYIISLNEFKNLSIDQYELIDIRNSYEFDKGHIENATNIPSNTLIETDNLAHIDDAIVNNKQVVLYAENPNHANSGWVFLYQMGYENIQVLSVETAFENNLFQTTPVIIEKPAVNYAQVLKEAQAKKEVKETPKPKPPKKVVTVKKKKKRAPEGGC